MHFFGLQEHALLLECFHKEPPLLCGPLWVDTARCLTAMSPFGTEGLTVLGL